MHGVVVIVVLTLLLRATTVAADPVRVLILAGQSNAVGYGSDASLLPPALSSPQTDVRFWFDEGPFLPLRIPRCGSTREMRSSLYGSSRIRAGSRLPGR